MEAEADAKQKNQKGSTPVMIAMKESIARPAMDSLKRVQRYLQSYS